MSRLTRDGTAEPISRDQILRRERGQENIISSCSADQEQDWQPYPVDPYSCYCICDDHTWYGAAGQLYSCGCASSTRSKIMLSCSMPRLLVLIAQIYSNPRNLGVCTLYSIGDSVQCIYRLLYVLDNTATHNTSRRTAAGRLIALLVHLLATVAWYSTWSSIVSDWHNHTNAAQRPQRAMQTVQCKRPPTSKTKIYHLLPIL